jgi:hypothetical protein
MLARGRLAHFWIRCNPHSHKRIVSVLVEEVLRLGDVFGIDLPDDLHGADSLQRPEPSWK